MSIKDYRLKTSLINVHYSAKDNIRAQQYQGNKKPE